MSPSQSLPLTVEGHLGLVIHIVRRMQRRLSVDVEHDELVSMGTIGLIEAVRSFDPSRGIAFSTFAAPRIRGAIFDELRETDHATRSQRRKERRLRDAHAEHIRATQKEPNEQDLADILGINLPTLRRWQKEVETLYPISWSEPHEPSGLPLSESVADPVEPPDLKAEHAADNNRLRDAIGRLEEREQVVLMLRYFDDLTYAEIATFLKVSVPRISQIHAKAIAKLRKALEPRAA